MQMYVCACACVWVTFCIYVRLGTSHYNASATVLYRGLPVTVIILLQIYCRWEFCHDINVWTKSSHPASVREDVCMLVWRRERLNLVSRHAEVWEWCNYSATSSNQASSHIPHFTQEVRLNYVGVCVFVLSCSRPGALTKAFFFVEPELWKWWEKQTASPFDRSNCEFIAVADCGPGKRTAAMWQTVLTVLTHPRTITWTVICLHDTFYHLMFPRYVFYLIILQRAWSLWIKIKKGLFSFWVAAVLSDHAEPFRANWHPPGHDCYDWKERRTHDAIELETSV